MLIKSLIMELKITSQQILKLIYALAWLVFIGLCIEFGGLLFNTIYALTIHAESTKQFWKSLNLFSLYQYDRIHFLSITVLMLIIAGFKAFLFYLIVKLVHDKKLNVTQPFNKDVCQFIFNFMYLTIGIAIFSSWGKNYTNWLLAKNIAMPSLEALQFNGADIWLFMGIVLLVIAQIFKRGLELQEENELTV